MLIQDGYAEFVAARVLDFLGFNTSWQRRLWDVSTSLALLETLEASQAVSVGALSGSALRRLQSSVKGMLGRDPAIAGTPVHQALNECLRSDLPFGGYDWLSMQRLLSKVETAYLGRWATIVSDPSRRPGPDRTAAAITAHLLDIGHSSSYLHRWWTYRIRFEDSERDLPSVIEEAHEELVKVDSKNWEVLIAFTARPGRIGDLPEAWIPPTKVSEWLDTNGFGSEGIRQNGGLVLEISARDPDAAVEKGRAVVERIGARVALTRRANLDPLNFVWVKGYKKPISFQRLARGVEVQSLEATRQLYEPRVETRVDEALELLRPLNDGPSSSAVAGGWAAVEALLVGPGDYRNRIAAAERLASVVTCSLPRAELTSLAYAHLGAADDELATKLNVAETNREKSLLTARAIADGVELQLGDRSDDGARNRMADLIADPNSELGKVRRYVADTIVRLYRQRNLVLHWGKVDAVALEASLRTAAPLVGAGMDRFAHSLFVHEIQPLELAAKARLGLYSLEAPYPDGIVSLLE